MVGGYLAELVDRAAPTAAMVRAAYKQQASSATVVRGNVTQLNTLNATSRAHVNCGQTTSLETQNTPKACRHKCINRMTSCCRGSGSSRSNSGTLR